MRGWSNDFESDSNCRTYISEGRRKLKMSTTARQLTRVISRPVKKLQKPRPLKGTSASRHSTVDATNLNAIEEIMGMVDVIANNLSKGNFDRSLQSNIISMSGLLKSYGQNLEVIYKDQLDRAFVIFRNGCRDENLDYTSRLHLLELIELRAMNWLIADSTTYYKHKHNHPDSDIISLSSVDSYSLNSATAFQNTQMLNSVNSAASQPLLLGPGEVVKSSGKFPAPTMIPGENYAIDEVVIRNSESGKVMGIRGRRVHMIEELSNTVISFQRVNPGTKERLVQITGPSEDKITYAKQLIEETIKRNASPIRPEIIEKEKHGSNSSLNSSASEDSSRLGGMNDPSKRTNLFHSFSTSDATIGEYKYTVTIGDDTLKITGTNPNLVTIAKLVLDEYFLSESSGSYPDGGEQEDGANEEGLKGNQFLSSSFPKSSSSILTERIQGKEDSTGYQQFVHLESVNDLIQRKAIGSGGDSGAHQKSESSNKSPRTIYSSEKILLLADSTLSKRTPLNWTKMMQEFPTIVKKPPIDWFDPKSYMKERPQESDAAVAIRSVRDSGSPDTPE